MPPLRLERISRFRATLWQFLEGHEDWVSKGVGFVRVADAEGLRRLTFEDESTGELLLDIPVETQDPESIYTIVREDGNPTGRIRFEHTVDCALSFENHDDCAEIYGALMGLNVSRKRRLADEARDRRDGRLWLNRKFADASIVCGDRTFPVHRALLAAASPVFETMLEGEMREAREARIVISEATPESVEAMLQYMYTSAIPDNAHVAKLFSLAQCYELQELAEEMGPRMLEGLHRDNVEERVRALQLHAESPGVNQLWQEMLKLLKAERNADVFQCFLEGLLRHTSEAQPRPSAEH